MVMQRRAMVREIDTTHLAPWMLSGRGAELSALAGLDDSAVEGSVGTAASLWPSSCVIR